MDSRENKMSLEQLNALRSAAASVTGDLGDVTQPGVQQQVNPSQPADNPYIVNQTAGTVPQPNQRTGMSRTEAMREAMKNNVAQSTQSQVQQMSQGDNYQPTQQTQQTVQQTGNKTVINTTQRSGVIKDGSDNSSDKGFKFTGPMALGLVGLVLVIGVIFIIIGSMGNKGKDKNNKEDNKEEQSTDTIASSEELEWIIEDDFNSTVFVSYSDAEVEELRGLGYTGKDIEDASNNHIPFRDLVKEAKAKRDAYVLETYSKILDTTSDDFKYYTSQTWLTLPQRDDMYEWNQTSEYSVRKNLDYEKIDVHGSQLFIKVYLDDNIHEDWFYLSVTPAEWLQLQDYGNVIVNYTYVTHWINSTDEWGGLTTWEDESSIFITSASLEIIS